MFIWRFHEVSIYVCIYIYNSIVVFPVIIHVHSRFHESVVEKSGHCGLISPYIYIHIYIYICKSINMVVRIDNDW